MRLKRVLGIIFLLISLAFSAVNINITGAVVGVSSSSLSLFSVLFFIAGLILALDRRQQPRLELGGLETTISSVMISNKALERSKKDSFVKQHMKQYMAEIEKIRQNVRARPQERIGEFQVSPQGQSIKGLRVAWHVAYPNGIPTLYVDDFLYHEGEGRYVSNWNGKVKSGGITLGDYISTGYQPASS